MIRLMPLRQSPLGRLAALRIAPMAVARLPVAPLAVGLERPRPLVLLEVQVPLAEPEPLGLLALECLAQELLVQVWVALEPLGVVA